jgi:hypothetical protein
VGSNPTPAAYGSQKCSISSEFETSVPRVALGASYRLKPLTTAQNWRPLAQNWRATAPGSRWKGQPRLGRTQEATG